VEDKIHTVVAFKACSVALVEVFGPGFRARNKRILRGIGNALPGLVYQGYCTDINSGLHDKGVGARVQQVQFSETRLVTVFDRIIDDGTQAQIHASTHLLPPLLPPDGLLFLLYSATFYSLNQEWTHFLPVLAGKFTTVTTTVRRCEQ
jgi:hypothetical protein